MFQKLVSHNDDIRRLVEKGYAVGFDGPHMIVRDIPYLDATRMLQWGAFVAKLVFIDDARVVQDDHQLYFTGGVPHNMDGSPVRNLAGGSHRLVLSEGCKDVVVQRSFSNKPHPSGKFENFFDKIENYMAHIAGPAMSLHGANPYTFRIVQDGQAPTVFKFQDTLTSRAEITELTRKFDNDVVAIIGLGGTGAYMLDYCERRSKRSEHSTSTSSMCTMHFAHRAGSPRLSWARPRRRSIETGTKTFATAFSCSPELWTPHPWTNLMA